MTSRAQQRRDTRERIIEAALETFAERGFRGSSTREIAARAGANQGLITYHFRTKDDLWRAAADGIFTLLRERLSARRTALDTPDADPRAIAREAIREYVRFAAEHPELFRMMVEEGKSDDERMQWLVDTHLKPMYENFRLFSAPFGPDLDDSMIPHAYYALAGAASVIFATAPECRRLTGLDPETEAAVETHAEFVARLVVP